MKKQKYDIWIQIVSFIVHLKTEYNYEDIAKVVKERFDTTTYELEKQLPKEKKVIGSMKDELGKKTLKEFVDLRA